MLSKNSKRSIELIYKLECHPDGEYVLAVLNLQEEFIEISRKKKLVGNYENPYLIFPSKDHAKIIHKIEELLFNLDEYRQSDF